MTRNCICSAQTQFKDTFSSVVAGSVVQNLLIQRSAHNQQRKSSKDTVESGRKWVLLIGFLSHTKAKWPSQEI